VLITGSVWAQPTVTDQFKKINTVEEANDWAKANASLKPEVFKLSVGKDSSLIDKRLLKQNKGDVFSVGYVTYKVVDANQSIQFRSSYIFLDGSSLGNSELDSLRKIIITKINAGANWDQLSDQYTMDGNKTHGDTGWFFGPETVPAELQDAIKNHKQGDVFAVDVSDKQWHYIVKKTFDDNFKKEITVLKANGR
jgi:parvulin-like peptidyl-prolyl isomerase